MKLEVHYQRVESSPWLEEFIISRISRLERYLGPYASVQVFFKYEDHYYSTALAVHNHLDYCYIGTGENLYESFVEAIDLATRGQGEESRKLKEKIHRRQISVQWWT